MVRKRVGDESISDLGIAAPRPVRLSYLHSTAKQVALCALTAPLFIALAGTERSLSLLCGALCAVLPQAWFALRMQRAARQRARRAATVSMAAAMGKLLLSAAAFAFVFAVVRPAQPLLVFAGFGGMWLVQVNDGLRLLRQPQR